MSYKNKLPFITTFIFDVDGVFNNGEVYLLNNEYVRTINSKDSYAIQYAAKKGYDIFIITGGNSEVVKDVFLRYGVREVFLKSSDKLRVYEDLKIKYGFKDEGVLYMGDDIPDYLVMEKVGLAACPNNAVVEIKKIADYQSPYNGGKQCVRDVIEQTLRVQEKWFHSDAHEW